MKIYTKTGDKGITSLFDGTRVAKNNIRVETYGTLDEVTSMLGVVVSVTKNTTSIAIIQAIQQDIFDIGSYLANPSKDISESFTLHVEERVSQFEKIIDDYTAQLPILNKFILPGGNQTGALLHVARTITRRAERNIITLAKQEPVAEIVIKYVNRLSDLLFTMSRFSNYTDNKKEVIWEKYIG